MSAPVQYYWPSSISGRGSIAADQNIQAGQFLILNSTVPFLSQLPYIFDKLVRSVAFYSAQNVSNARFKITGIGSPIDGNGPTQALDLITEIVAGPNNTTVFSANIYSQIISIEATVGMPNATFVNVGPGNFGITDYFFFDYNRIIGQVGLQFQFFDQVSLEASVFQSLTKPEIPSLEGNLIKQNIPAIAWGNPLENVTGDIAVNNLFVTSVLWATITQDTADDDSLIFTIIQQGIR